MLQLAITLAPKPTKQVQGLNLHLYRHCAGYFTCWVIIGTSQFFKVFLIFLYFKEFYWSIVDLQGGVNFCSTAKWFIYTYKHIHFVSDSFPILGITEYWVEFPLLNSRSLSPPIPYISVCTCQTQALNPSLPFLLGNQEFVFKVCESISVL